jgi:hypothetical protein
MCGAFDVDKEYIEDVKEHASAMAAWRSVGVEIPSTLTPAEVLAVAEGLLTELTEEERTEVFNFLQAKFCTYCGRKQPNVGYCQCDNDE